MTWSTPFDLKAQLARLWDRGELLRALVTGESRFPLRLTLKAPSSTEFTDRFEDVRAWASALTATARIRTECREVRHRVHGLQRLPEQVWIDSLDDALALLGRDRDAGHLSQAVELTRATVPALLPWLARHPLQAIELADQWPRFTAVVQWAIAHPRPGVYLRQVDVPGVHTKFIESHRAALSEMLDLVLPRDVINPNASGASQFAIRYGFLDKPIRIRFRILDERIRLLPGAGHPDVTLDAGSFANLNLPARRVFITENETNFLAFPPTDAAIVIFGAGYGWDALARARWLSGCAVHYWGDIDTHGFAILDELRARFDDVSSLLMDRDTLSAHETHWGEEPDQVQRDLFRLTPAELALFDTLRDNRIRKNLRLEQERVRFSWLTEALSRIFGITPR